ncbi:hypothetical protein K457DRAFT_133191 [Linnemannia elongata AG-77]|uniref:Microtubule-associated protein n=1 Tax=Linnemannia elongata AG-77 TaxID=1314771 RepID=A0A197KB63_9FUNG|nr:hypothetical protein K457DRAFT_133191 [Linnemannia elongata AG-77]
MTSVSTSPQSVPAAPHVKVERRATRDSFRTTANTVSPTSPTQKPALATNRRFSGVQSKVGSMDAINYKPKPSEKKIQSFKSDFSHVKSKVDAKMVLPNPEAQANTEAPAPPSPGVAVPTTKRPTVITTGFSLTPSSRVSRPTVISPSSSQPQRVLSPPSSRRSSVTINSIRTAASSAISAATQAATVGTPRSPPHSRRSSTSSVPMTGTPMAPTSPTRRLSKHIIPTQKASYDHVKSKVGSFENVKYAARGRPNSRDSSADEGNGRSRSPSAMSSTSSTSAAPTSPTNSTGRRSSFKIPASKKVDYSKVTSKVGSMENIGHTPQGGNLKIFNEKLNAPKVQSKVGSMEYINHTPQGGNLKVFSEKLSFREQAQSKIAKEINIVQFYQSSEMSFDTSIQEEREGEEDIESSIIYSEAEQEDFEPPKNILSVLEEVTEAVEKLDLVELPQQQQ